MKKIVLTLSVLCFSFFYSQKNQNYLEVSYGSICCGPPSDVPVMNYITQFQKKNKLKAFEIYEQSGLGREGEFSFYIGIDKLSKTQKSNFIKGLKAVVKAQNDKRNESRDGIVYFEESAPVTQSDLSKKTNITLYKKTK
ncbi:hypothetical protein [Chryseobacterium daecheongense]|uniref:Uncharacterized protein n=1 Tax=Chryseobacterium daecheongense TaxID=192389 RepID=A0A3N0W5S1_9FLAO|nr:hypothetical protein [Chryseobacterium daecheongense]ROI00121.1 hypothetical protein EGI05_04340 [Chryseobacterium daecheongense]TDX94930.1 hypothetical protein BCF50_0702 [Chryseobacterium daecheongense]